MKTSAELERTIRKLKREMLKARKAEIKAGVHEVKKLMKRFGISVADLGSGRIGTPAAAKSMGNGAKKPKSQRAPVKPKYRNPGNKTQTWTGRGRSPLWVREYLGKGKKLEDLAIK